MTRGKSVLGLSLVWFLIMTWFASAQTVEPGVTDTAIRIGILCPLSGPDSKTGTNLLEGFQTFVKHVNDTGGVHGRSLVLVARDDGNDPERGVFEMRRMLLEGKTFAIASTSGVPTTQALIDHGILTDPIPVLAGGAISKGLLSDFKRNVFFFGMTYGDQIVLAVEHLLKKKPGRYPQMGLLARDGFPGEEVREGFYRVCRHYGLQTVGEERYSEGTDESAPLLDRLRVAGADHVVLAATTVEAIQIMRNASSLGWFPQFIGPSSTVDPKRLVEAGDGAGGYLVVDYLARSWERTPGVSLMARLTEKYYPRKNTDTLHRYHILGYISGLLITHAPRGAGRDLSRVSLIEAFERIQNLDTHGLTGALRYDTGSRLADCGGRVLRFKKDSGMFVPLTDWTRPMIRVSQ